MRPLRRQCRQPYGHRDGGDVGASDTLWPLHPPPAEKPGLGLVPCGLPISVGDQADPNQPHKANQPQDALLVHAMVLFCEFEVNGQTPWIGVLRNHWSVSRIWLRCTDLLSCVSQSNNDRKITNRPYCAPDRQARMVFSRSFLAPFAGPMLNLAGQKTFAEAFTRPLGPRALTGSPVPPCGKRIHGVFAGLGSFCFHAQGCWLPCPREVHSTNGSTSDARRTRRPAAT